MTIRASQILSGFITIVSAFTCCAVTLEVNVPKGTEQTNFTEAQYETLATLTADDEIVKTGEGALIVTSDKGIGSFVGTLRVSEGVYVIGVKEALGKKDAQRVIVSSGATLYTDVYIGESESAICGATIHVAGTGYTGLSGALVVGGRWNGSGYKAAYPLRWHIVVDADATIAKGDQSALLGAGSTIDLGGHFLMIANGLQYDKVESYTDGYLQDWWNVRYAVEAPKNIILAIDVAAGVTRNEYTSAERSVLSGNIVTEVRKTGLGVLDIGAPAGIKDFNGVIRVKAGVLALDAIQGLGTKAGATYIEDGATLHLRTSVPNDRFFGEVIHVAGAGASGMGGAIVSKASNVSLGSTIVLDADAALGRPADGAFTLENAPIDLGGHTLTLVGNAMGVNATEILNPGKIVAACDLTVKPLSETGGLDVSVELSDDRTLTLDVSGQTASANVSGDLTGGGNVVVKGAATSGDVFFSGVNTYSGTTMVDGCNLVFLTEASAPGWADDRLVSGTSASSAMYFAGKTASRPDGWTRAALEQILQQFKADGSTVRNWTFGIWVDPGEDVTLDPAFETTSYDAMFLLTRGGGRAVLDSEWPATGFDPARMFVYNSSAVSNVVYSSPTASMALKSNLKLNGADVTFENLGYILSGNYQYYYNKGTYARPGRFTVGEGTCLDYGSAANGRSVYTYHDAASSAAIVTLDGGIVSNGVVVSDSSKTGLRGTYVQRSGAMRLYQGGGEFTVGESEGGIGCVEVLGGELSIGSAKALNLSLYAPNAGVTAIWRQKGGAVTAAGNMTLGSSADVDFRQSGGTLVATEIVQANGVTGPANSYGKGVSNGTSRVVFDGTADVTFAKGLKCSCRVDSSAVVAFNGGSIVRAPFVNQAGRVSAQVPTRGTAYANFNGGTLEATASGTVLGADYQAFTRVFVHDGGAGLSAAEGVTTTVGIPLEAPAGSGIASITSDRLPLACSCSGYVIIRGDGVGAAASCEFDATKFGEKIVSITVTSPGSGYTWAEAELFTGSGTANIPLTVTLAAESGTGALVKKGAGTVVLNAVNTYGGDTVVSNGVLKLGCVGALPNGTVAKCPGGFLDANDPSYYPANLTFDVSDFDFSDVSRKYVLARNFGSGDPVAVGVPKGWKLRNANGTVKLSQDKGLLLIFR